MEISTDRSLLVKLIVLKKACFSLILITISLLSAWSWRNYDVLTNWAENYLVDAEFHLVQQLLDLVLNTEISNLRLIARLSGVYGMILGIGTIGLWYGKTWAHILFVGLVGMLLPVEILELLHHISPTTLLIFIINLGIFSYLLYHLLSSNHTPQSSGDLNL